MIYNINRTEWSPIQSAIIQIINKREQPSSGTDLLIMCMITDRIEHTVLLPINLNQNKS